MQSQLPQFSGLNHPSWKLNTLADLVAMGGLIVAPPLVLEPTTAGSLLRFQSGEGFFGIKVEDSTGTPSFEPIATIQTQYMTLTSPATGRVLMAPFIADYDKFGIVNLTDQWLGYGRKKFEKIQIGNDLSANRYGIDFDYNYPLNELILKPSDPSAKGMLLNFKGQRWLRSGGAGVPTGLTLVEVFTTEGFLSYGIGTGPSAASFLLIPHPAIPVGPPLWSWGASDSTFFSTGDVMTAKAYHVGTSDNPAFRKSGITDTNAIGDKFAGGILYEKGTVAPQTGLQFQDEGSNLGTSGTVTEVDFVGAGVTATRAANKITVTVPSGGVTDGDKGDITVSGGGTSWTIDSGAVTYAKMQTVTGQRLLGNPDPTTGSVTEIPLGAGLAFMGGALVATGGPPPPPPPPSDLTYVEGVLPAPVALGAAWTATGLSITIPSTGRYVIEGKARLVVVNGAAATTVSCGLFKNGVLISQSQSLYRNPTPSTNGQVSVALHCLTLFCVAGETINLRGYWVEGPPADAFISTGADGQTTLTAVRIASA